jgi:hypothetical protein
MDFLKRGWYHLKSWWLSIELNAATAAVDQAEAVAKAARKRLCRAGESYSRAARKAGHAP